MLNPTHSVTVLMLYSHVADDHVNLSWLVGISKPGMPLSCSDVAVSAMHDGFYKKKNFISSCKCTFTCV